MARNNRNKGSRYNAKKDAEQGNFQDAAEAREFNKGRNSNKNRGKGSGSKSSCPINTGSSDNDPKWYAVNPSILRDTASFPYSRITGVPILNTPGSVQKPALAVGGVSIDSNPVPGILSVNWIPTIGGANSETDAINIAANSIYSFVRHANSGHSNYDAPNLMNYLLAMDSAYSFYSMMVRAYGVLNNYEMLNKYTPQALITAMRLDFADLQKNMANFRAYINQYAYRLSSLAVPVDIYYITRHIWMNENIYTDAETTKAQYYMYYQAGYWRWIEGSSVEVLGRLDLTSPSLSTHLTQDTGCLRPVNVSNLSDLISFGNGLLGPIIGSEDMNIMSGDILKAFGAENLFKVLPISETYFVTPSYNQEVLSQFENAETAPCVIQPQTGSSIWYGYTFQPSYPAITGTYASKIMDNSTINAGWLEEDIKIVIPQLIASATSNASATLSPEQYMRSNRIILNMHKEGVTPEDTIVASRLSSLPSTKMYYSSTNGAYAIYDKHSYGSELATSMSCWAFVEASTSGSDSSGLVLSYFTFGSHTAIQRATGSVAALITDAIVNISAVMASFDWHPKFTFTTFNVTGASAADTFSWSTYPMIYDYENVALLDSDNVKQMNETALLSLLNCQRMGSFSPKA